ncbi:MAG: TetR/AcrR family transcriptional regulator [Anaerolineae bacterium]|nr:TetR/AcrR family transcriptional regulator [Anaerolineae bacterium]
MKPSSEYHEPRQARSRARVERILAAAAQLFAQHPYDSVTTNHIAGAAGVPIGSLYQYFPHKEALLAALVGRYVTALEQVFPQPQPQTLSLESFIGQMLERLLAFENEHAGFGVMFTTLDALPGLSVTGQIHAVIQVQVEAVLHAYYPALTEAQRSLCASASIGIVKGLIILARPPYALPPPGHASGGAHRPHRLHPRLFGA